MDKRSATVIKVISVMAAATLAAVGSVMFYIKNAEQSEKNIVTHPIITSSHDLSDKADSSAASDESEVSADSKAVYPMDINRAAAADFTAVKGIGGVTAGNIIDYRAKNGKIHDIAELSEIDGIGEEICALIAEYFYVDEADFVKFTTTTTAKTTQKTKKTAATKAKVKTTTTAVTTKAASFPIDINKVTKDELMQIDGVGEGMAGKILALRESKGKITDMEQLLEVYGIGEDRLIMLEGFLYVSESDYSKASTTTTTTVATTTTAPAQTKTTVRTTTKTAKTTAKTTTTTADIVPEPKQKRQVNINEADADEIADALLIDKKAAEMIVMLREKIHGYSNILEVLYLEEFDKQYDTAFYNSIKDYIYI